MYISVHQTFKSESVLHCWVHCLKNILSEYSMKINNEKES